MGCRRRKRPGGNDRIPTRTRSTLLRWTGVAHVSHDSQISRASGRCDINVRCRIAPLIWTVQALVVMVASGGTPATITTQYCCVNLHRVVEYLHDCADMRCRKKRRYWPHTHNSSVLEMYTVPRKNSQVKLISAAVVRGPVPMYSPTRHAFTKRWGLTICYVRYIGRSTVC